MSKLPIDFGGIEKHKDHVIIGVKICQTCKKLVGMDMNFTAKGKILP